MIQNSDKETLFIGKITASITHEIKNVLASIKELNGLMEDLVSMSDNFPLKEKFQKTIPKISAQVERGTEITMNFNAFAHLTDAEKATLNIKAVAKHLVYLSRRIARQKNIELVAPEDNASAEIEINPLHLYMGIFYVLEYMINMMKNDGTVTIITAAENGNIQVNLICEGEFSDWEKFKTDPDSSDEWSGLKNIVGLSGSSVEINESNNGFEIKLPGVDAVS